MIQNYKKEFRKLYSKNSKLIDIIGKIILSFFVLSTISSEVKFPFIFSNVFVLIIISIILGFLHINILALVSLILFLVSVFNTSKIAFIYILLIVLISFCLFFRYKPSSLIYVLITFILVKFNMPFLAASFFGIMFAPSCLLTNFIGIIFYYMLKLPLTTSANFDFISGFLKLSNSIFGNFDFIAIIISSAVVICISYLIKKLKNNKILAINISMIIGEVVLFSMYLIFGNSFKYTNILLFIVSLLISNLLLIFTDNSDYKRMEILEYEDDDYYYYVKAIPKLKSVNKNEEIDYEEYDNTSYLNEEGIGNETREIASDYYLKE